MKVNNFVWQKTIPTEPCVFVGKRKSKIYPNAFDYTVFTCVIDKNYYEPIYFQENNDLDEEPELYEEFKIID